MANTTRNKKGITKQKVPKKSERRTSPDQKENRPKKKKVIKSDPNDSIAMSKQLIKKKNNQAKRRTASKDETRICGNGKPIPSLAELEKMFADSDDEDQPVGCPESSTKEMCATPTPEKQPSVTINENKLLSPTTINKISERMLDLISNISDPIELLENIPPPVIPPKKRKKSDVPYIVGCKDRTKVVKKPNTDFCKGGDDYGVQASSGDQEESPPMKRAKKSKIPMYSKSIFNAKCDEIAERLTKDDPQGLSDGSSDSNKTIEYDTTLYHSHEPVSFSPLPSTSRDNETFIKNDELFNQSLRGNHVINDIPPKKKEDKEIEVQIIDIPCKTSDPIEIKKSVKIESYSNLIDTNDTEIIQTIELDNTPQGMPRKYSEDDCVLLHSTENKNENNSNFVLIDNKFNDINVANKNNNQNSSNSIVIDDEYSNIRVANEHSQNNPNSIVIDDEHSDINVANENRNQNNSSPIIIDDEYSDINMANENSNQNNSIPIVIDDEYSNINVANDTYNTETIEIIDIDDVIAENKSILDKWKNDRAEILDNINVVVDVPNTCLNSTTSNTLTNNTTHTVVTSSTRKHNNCGTNSQNIPNFRQTINKHSQRPIVLVPNSINHSTPNARSESGNTIEKIVSNFFKHKHNFQWKKIKVNSQFKRKNSNIFKSIIDSISNNSATVMATIPQQVNNEFNHVTTPSQRNIDNRARNPVPPTVNLTEPLDDTRKQQTNVYDNPTTTPSRNLGECPICMDPLSTNGIASTICGHVFCLKCIQAAIRANGKRCPTCRKALKGAGGGYHQLYL